MSNGKATKEKTLIDEVLKGKRNRVKQYGLGRQLKGVQASRLIGTSGAKGGSDSSNNGVSYLKTAGGTMIGPIAFYPESHSIVNGVVDVSESTSGVYTSRVVALGESGAADNIVTIKGAAHAGQILYLQAVVTTALTLLPLNDASQTAWVTSTAYALGDIRINNSVIYTCILAHTSGASTEPGVGGSWETNWLAGNIYMPNGVEYIIAGKEIVQLQFDSINNSWTILGVGSSAGDNLGNHTATTQLDMATFNIGSVDTILFNDTVQTIGSITTGMEVRQSDTFDFSYWFNGVETYTLAQGAMNFHDQNISQVDTILFTNPVTTIASITTGMEHRVGDTKDISFWFNGAELYTMAQGAMDFHSQNIAVVDTILFTNPVTTIASISSGMEFRIGDTKDYSLWIFGTEEYTFNQTEFIVNTNKIEFSLATQFMKGDANGIQMQVPVGAGSTIDFSTSGGSSTFNIGQSTTVSNQDFDVNANALILDSDADTKIQAGTDDVIGINTGGGLRISIADSDTTFLHTITAGAGIDMGATILDLDTGSSNVIYYSTNDNYYDTRASGEHRFAVNTDIKLYITDNETIFEDPAFVQIDIHNKVANPTDNTIISQIDSIAETITGGTDVTYTQIQGLALSTVHGTAGADATGQLNLRVTEAGSLNLITYISANGTTPEVGIHKDMDFKNGSELAMNSAAIRSIGGATIGDLTLVTAAATDMVMIRDATDGAMKKVDVSDFSAAGANVQLSNLAATVAVNRNLIFNTTSGDTMGAADFGIGMSAATTLDVKAGSGGTILFKQASTTKMILSTSALTMQTATELAMGGNAVSDIQKLKFGTGTAIVAGDSMITDVSSNMNFNVPTGKGYLFEVQDAQVFGLGASTVNCFQNVAISAGIDMNNTSVTDLNTVTFNSGATILDTATTFAITSGATTRDIFLNVGGNVEVEIGDTSSVGYLQIRNDQVGGHPELRVLNEYTSLGDADIAGVINVSAWDSSDIQSQFLGIRVTIADVTATSRDSLVEFLIQSAGGEVSGAANVSAFSMEGNGTSAVPKIAFRGNSPVAKATISGNTSTYVESILTQLLTALDNMGLITDSTTT